MLCNIWHNDNIFNVNVKIWNVFKLCYIIYSSYYFITCTTLFCNRKTCTRAVKDRETKITMVYLSLDSMSEVLINLIRKKFKKRAQIVVIIRVVFNKESQFYVNREKSLLKISPRNFCDKKKLNVLHTI